MNYYKFNAQERLKSLFDLFLEEEEKNWIFFEEKIIET